jgi:hypothetical protein
MSERPTRRLLDVGCGANKSPGALGIDCRQLPAVDVIHDLDVHPWPLAADSFDVIICRHIIEHMADVRRFLNEVHRVGSNGAAVHIETPHFSSLESWADPSHRQHLSARSFEFFTADGYLQDGGVFRIERVALTFRKALLSQCGRLLYRLWPRGYEQNAAYILPARDIRVTLVVVK